MHTYHDYSMLQPDLVYYQVGYNLVYKAIRDNIKTKDSITNIRFIDINGDIQTLTESIKDYTSVPDTFLVFRNINENIDDRFIVCAPEVNTPENWAKISDYGYIFHYDVYSKEEIESHAKHHEALHNAEYQASAVSEIEPYGIQLQQLFVHIFIILLR